MNDEAGLGYGQRGSPESSPRKDLLCLEAYEDSVSALKFILGRDPLV
jgi:hypothetical protein